MSTAPMAWTSAPRRPVIAVARYTRSQTATGSPGSRPIRTWPKPWSMVWVPGASMQARATHALTSLSPTPTKPSSVSISTTMSSCAELVASAS